MGKRLLPLLLFGLVGLVGAAGAISGNSGWGRAIRVPGTATGADAGTVESISCPKAGTCAVVGQFAYRKTASAFVVDERNGTWGTAMKVRGIGNGLANATSVSCATTGNCAAGGTYWDASHHQQVFVVDERHGHWGTAVKVPVAGSLNAGLNSVSCGTPGNCVAGGEYNGSKQGAFLVEETNGKWEGAILVPGLAALSGAGNEATVQSVSCATAGNCAAGGFYFKSDGTHAFVVNETNGVWGDAIEVPGTAALGTGGASVSSVSCGGAGNCAAGGMYVDADDAWQAFVVDETNGTWGTAIEAPGTATLNTGGRAYVNSVSCPTVGTCSAGGTYEDGADFESGHERPFVVDETNGSWGAAIEVPGTAAPADDGETNSISCATAGNCTAAGFYYGSHGPVFVADEKNGSWGDAIAVPGVASLIHGGGGAAVNSVSCGAAGVCVVGGYTSPNRGPQMAWVAGSGTRALTVPSAPHLKSVAPGDMKIDVTWSKPADKGGVPIAGYRATAKAGRHVFSCNTAKLSCTIAGLKNGTTYTVTVVAKNTVGRSAPSNAKKARPRA
jgi:hypothetical protein